MEQEGDREGRAAADVEDVGGRDPAGLQGAPRGVTVAGGAAGPPARVRAGCGRAGQPPAGHGAVQAEAAAAGVAGRGEMLLVARGDQALRQRTTGEGG